MKKFKADKDSDLDYSVDWSDWLTQESILTSTWIVTDGTVDNIEIHDNGIGTGIVTYTFIKFENAVEGDSFTITNRITTTSVIPRTEDQSFIIEITEK